AVVRRDRQRGHALARGGRGDRFRASAVRHAGQPGGGEAGDGEADPARAGPSAGGAGAVKPEVVRPYFEALLAHRDPAALVRGDPVELPHRYRDPRDIEVAALLCAALAYGRVDLFKPRLAALLERLGESPAAVAQNSTHGELLRRASGFSYRMTGAREVA